MDSTCDSTHPFESGDADKGNRFHLPQQLGKYKLTKLVGTGMSHVFLGWDTVLDREVAVKLLPRPRHENSTSSTASSDNPILNEAQRIAALNTPGIVTLYDCGSDWGELEASRVKVDFLVYKYVRGETLRQWAQRHRSEFNVLANKFAEIADILGAIHAAGIYHRDIKPSNILIDESNHPIVIDFGLALLAYSVLGRHAWGIGGTFAYMSPEQAAGQNQLIDGRSDLYALGVCMYELFTGRLPFRHEGVDSAGRPMLLQAILDRHPQPVRQLDDSIPIGLAEICMRLLAKSREQRYPTAADLAVDLRRYLGEVSPAVDRHLIVVQSYDRHWAEGEVDFVRNRLQGTTNTVDPLDGSPLIELSPNAEFDTEAWRRLIARSIIYLRRGKQLSQIVHLVPRTAVLCAFALGIHMNHQHNCILYHVQNGRLFRIWHMDRATKTARSPTIGRTEELEFFADEQLAEVKPTDVSSEARALDNEECLVIQVGANPILRDVIRWRDQHRPLARIRCLTKRRSTLDPDDTHGWIQAASEIAGAIKCSPGSDVYLFTDAPAVLALMAGDAIGHWSGKWLHLMQFCRNAGATDVYVEVLKLPDERLNAMLQAGTPCPAGDATSGDSSIA